LAASIRKDGVLQPIVARENGHGFQTAAGARRVRASKKAGLREIPVIVRDLTDEQMRRYGIVENFHRLKLAGPELEDALGRIWKEDYKGKSQAEMARDIGMNKSMIHDYLGAFLAKEDGLVSSREHVSARDISGVSGFAKESKESREAAETLLSARSERILTDDQLDEATAIVREAPKEKRAEIAKGLVHEAETGKKLSKIGFEMAKEDAKDYAEGKSHTYLEIVLNHDQRLLNRMADLYSWVRKCDISYLEGFDTPMARGRALEVLETTHTILGDTLRQARAADARKRWEAEWKELRQEKGLPEIKASAIPSVKDILGAKSKKASK
jgi:ParB/RepB/Spo0J family partition protein